MNKKAWGGEGKDKDLFYLSVPCPVGGRPSDEEFKRLGMDRDCPEWHLIRAKLTGEFREPKKGEWYISGAIPNGYRALEDLTAKYHIAVLVKVKVETVRIVTEI